MAHPARPLGLGSTIKEFRERQGLSQGEMASRLGMSRAYLAQIESRNRGWPQKYVSAIARELGVSQASLAVTAGLISHSEAAAA